MNKLWHKALIKYRLPLDLDRVSKDLVALGEMYPDIESENHLFYVFMKNALGSYLSAISDDHTDLLSWVKIVKRPDVDLYMYVFEEHNDFALYNDFIGKIADQIDGPTLHFFNLNCPEWVVKNSN